jgi:serine/threonine protein phosphatase 1
MELYAIGDVHGRADLLVKALGWIVSQPGFEGTVVTLGDYIDRGPESKECINILRLFQEMTHFNMVCLQGNHEAMMVASILGDDSRPGNNDNNDNNPHLMWLLNGGQETVDSYGGDYEAMKEHAEWMAKLPMYYENGKYIFVHAGLTPGKPLDQQTEAELQWMRKPFTETNTPVPKRIVVHGHTPVVHGPEFKKGRYNIDVGSHHTGRLCVIRLGEDGLQQAKIVGV